MLGFVDGGMTIEDAWPLGIKGALPITEGCFRTYPTQSWCRKWKDAKDIKEGDMVDVDTIPDGKEELILRRIDADDTTLITLLKKLGFPIPDLSGLGGWFLILDYQDAAIDNTIDSKDFHFRKSLRPQGLQAEFDTGIVEQEETLKQEEKLTETKSTWTIDSTQETRHKINLNHKMTPVAKIGAIAATETISLASLAQAPPLSFFDSYWDWSTMKFIYNGELKKEYHNETNYSWSTPK
jgi:hypothetical protein